jgi:type IV pilus assembly protein PilN
MMDLENVLPSGVQVLNIDPVPMKDGKVTIRLRVSGAHDKGVELVRNLEHSRRFISPRLARETAETSQQNGNRQVEQVSAPSNVNFDLLAEYNPLPEKPSASGTKSERPVTTHSAPKKAGRKKQPGKAVAR